MKALLYNGLKEGCHTLINDARTIDKESSYIGQPVRIERGDYVPLALFSNEEWSGDVAAIHQALGLCVMVDVPDDYEWTADYSSRNLGGSREPCVPRAAVSDRGIVDVDAADTKEK
jgi:hypothetical protein